MDTFTIICRCEEINLEEIITAINQGAQTFDDVKRLTRCGMGPCQAKLCHNMVNKIISNHCNKSIDKFPVTRFRIPLRPVPIHILASSDEDKLGTLQGIMDRDDEAHGER